MKIPRIFFFRIIFLFAVVCCFAVNANSNCGIQPINIELPAGPSSAEHCLTSDNDFGHGDEITQACNFWLVGIPLNRFSIPENTAVTYQFSISVWQPPKIS